MKPISIDTKRAIALAAVLVSAACIISAADDVIPLIRMVDVPLADAIKTLARQSNLNWTLNCRRLTSTRRGQFHFAGNESPRDRHSPLSSTITIWP